jgi:protocatechuate 3,4-dioxygenase, alpha subunit
MLTPSQTIGPYFAIGLDWPGANRLIAGAVPGTPIVIEGCVFDGDGRPVPDALIEIWQADAQGLYHGTANDAFRGAGRTAVADDGSFRFETIKPGAVADGAVVQAPHINVLVFARGLLVHLHTRIYFADEAAANAVDPVLACVPQARRATVIAAQHGDVHRFDIRLQGVGETVFFDV